MFWKTFVTLCNKIGKKPNPVAKELGISSGAVNKWKNGAIPQATTLHKIANYFNVTTKYLLTGKEESTNQENVIKIFGRDGTYQEKHLTDDQIKMLQAMINTLPEAPDDL